MAQTTIRIISPGGKTFEFQLPDTIPIARLLPRLVSTLKLPGDPQGYTLFDGDRALPGEHTLGRAEVANGATLRLAKESITDIQPRQKPAAPHDHYVAEANARWPALIIYLLDVSGSMQEQLGTKTRIQVVEETLRSALKTMVQRSLRGNTVSPRYRIAVITYSDKVKDFYRGVQTISEIVDVGLPEVSARHTTNTADAFAYAKALLEKELPGMQVGTPGSRDSTYPAPLICHLTDGEYTKKYGDPEPIAREIRRLRVPDGRVLIENIYLSDRLLDTPPDIRSWTGFRRDTNFSRSAYANRLLAMSSDVPDSYCQLMNRAGYQVQPGTAMLYPGTSPELVEMAFQMSVATPVSAAR